ncbi:MAG: hypothetical protein Q9195_007761 [Heterodermia aff. obscurata]
MSSVNITVKNKSGVTRAYFLFVKAPEVSLGDKVFSNVYIQAPPVPNGNGTASFSCQTDYFAVCGTNPGQPLGSKVQVTTGDWGIAKINQGGKNGSHFLMKGDPGNAAAFDGSNLKQDCDQKGAFLVESTGFKLGNGGKHNHNDSKRSYRAVLMGTANQFIGLGARDPFDPTNIIPVACVPAQPSTQAYFVPHNTYYVSWGTYLPGQIVDITTISDPAEVDFTGKAATMAKVEHTLDGSWNVTFN